MSTIVEALAAPQRVIESLVASVARKMSLRIFLFTTLRCRCSMRCTALRLLRRLRTPDLLGDD